ncbi:GIY-YIG nuclease family protein [Fulvivirga sp. RKSG066]|uniref:GIY-YIG nuclease family protein n=1 Tax=Fulvivirga aurantia TaxID=2529383 RepID=UPI0012BD0614|nr:GIY-YIG nuclease family protein [Fulvivirga aurantia]MTI20773.1 GIY-YIG nuclease family protein [Fulvivirga aurantia]
MYKTYAIDSISRNYLYVGISNNVERRLTEHNSGKNKTTRPYKPFILIYTKEFETRIEARAHEKYLKSGSGKEFLKKLRNK